MVNFIVGALVAIVSAIASAFLTYTFILRKDNKDTQDRKQALLEELNDCRFKIENSRKLLEDYDFNVVPNEVNLFLFKEVYPKVFTQFTPKKRKVITILYDEIMEFNRILRLLFNEPRSEKSADYVYNLLEQSYIIIDYIDRLNDRQDLKANYKFKLNELEAAKIQAVHINLSEEWKRVILSDKSK